MPAPPLPPANPALAAGLIFAATYAVLGFGALPPLRLDRAGAALVGGTAMVVFGVLTPSEALAAIDAGTLALLFGMMIVIAHLRLAGFFRVMGDRALSRAGSPRMLLAIVVALSGTLSAFFVNDTACLLLTPLVLEVTEASRLPAVPYLLGIALGANVGSVATIVGNPQNMLIASFSGLRYGPFLTHLAPVAVAGLALTAALLDRLYGAALRDRRLEPSPARGRIHRRVMTKAVVVTVLLFAALLAGVAPALAALGAASLLLVTRRLDPLKIYALVDWSLLVMFAGLFVVIAGVERAGLTAQWMTLLEAGGRTTLPALAMATTALSNLVSNVPAVLLLRSWVAEFPSPERAWLTLAMASTLAGNLTLVGSVANLIVVTQARGHARVGFWEYARAGIPLTLATVALGTAWIAWTVPAR